MSVSARVHPPARIRHATAISLALGLVLVAQELLAAPARAAAGDLDRTFGNDGVVRSIPKFGFATDVIVQSDQRIVIADTAFGVARLLANGARDTS